MNDCSTYLIEPVRFVPSMLVSTTIVDTDPVWAAGTYDLADVVIKEVVSTEDDSMKGMLVLRRWESLVAGNTGEPGVDADKWLNLGPADSVAAFDDRIGTVTRMPDDDPLVMRIAPGRQVSAIAMFGVEGTSARVRVLNDSIVAYDETRHLTDQTISNWLEYFTEPIEQSTSRLLFTGLPSYFYSQIEVTITGHKPAVSLVSFGSLREIGSSPSHGAEAGTDDYSVKEVDGYGSKLVPLATADYQNLTLLVEKGRVNHVFRLLRRMVSMPVVLVASLDESYAEALVNYGWIGSHRFVFSYPTHSVLDITFKGLT